jgi:outer membrane protein assembly factor BamB
MNSIISRLRKIEKLTVIFLIILFGIGNMCCLSSCMLLLWEPDLNSTNFNPYDKTWRLGFDLMWHKTIPVDGHALGAKYHSFDKEYFFLGATGDLRMGAYLYKVDDRGNTDWAKDLKVLSENSGLESSVGWVTAIKTTGNQLYVCADDGAIGNNDSELFCLDKVSGDFIWKKYIHRGVGHRFSYLPDPWGDYLIFATNNVDAQMFIYVFPMNSLDGEPVIIREYYDMLYSIGDGHIYEDKLYLLTTRYLHRVFDLNKIIDESYSDEECISFQADIPEEYKGWGGPGKVVFYNDTYINEEIYTLTCRKVSDNSIVWQTELDQNSVSRTPYALYDEKMFIPGWSGLVSCVDMRSGEILWQNDATPYDPWDPVYQTSNLDATGIIIENAWYVQPSYSESCCAVFDIETGEKLLVFPLETFGRRRECWYHQGVYYQLTDDGLAAIRFYENVESAESDRNN